MRTVLAHASAPSPELPSIAHVGSGIEGPAGAEHGQATARGCMPPMRAQAVSRSCRPWERKGGPCSPGQPAAQLPGRLLALGAVCQPRPRPPSACRPGASFRPACLATRYLRTGPGQSADRRPLHATGHRPGFVVRQHAAASRRSTSTEAANFAWAPTRPHHGGCGIDYRVSGPAQARHRRSPD